MDRNIMLAFVSTVSPNSLKAPITYDIHGARYEAVQTNESAIVYVERGLGNASLEQIFLIVTRAVKTGKIPTLPKPKPEPKPPAPPPEPSLSEFLRRWVYRKFGFFKPEEPPPVVPEPVVEEPPPPAVTHLEFLKARLVKEFPHFADRFTEIDYSDSSDSLDENILQIAEIADAVTAYAKRFADDRIILHADMTGGFRHTSMLMLSIIQLLSYRGIKTGEILYSDPAKKIVYRANEIQSVSLLITGADEFVKFGSVNALREYFGEVPSAASDLLSAMKNFSDAIKICRTDTLESDLERLGDEIQKFSAIASKDLKSTLFAKILDTVEEGYGELIHGGATRFEIIRWCMKKGFWQQAMTLCTEWLPEEIVARKIFMPGNSAVQALAEAGSDWRNWQQHFVIAYSNTKPPEPVKDAPSQADIDTFCQNIQSVLKMSKVGDVGSFTGKNYYGELTEFLSEFEKGYNDFIKCRKGKLKFDKFKGKFPHLATLIQTTYDARRRNRNFNKQFDEFMNSFGYNRIIDMLISSSNVALLEVLNVDRAKIPREEVKPLFEVSDTPESKWLNRQRIYSEMLDNKVARSELNDRKLALELLHDFYEIRRKRNEINHAAGTAEIAELQSLVKSYLSRLEELH